MKLFSVLLVIFLAIPTFCSNPFFELAKSKFYPTYQSEFSQQKRQLLPPTCPVVTCSGAGGTCSSTAPCTVCSNNAIACQNANAGNGTAYCSCILQEIACYAAHGACLNLLSNLVQTCNSVFTGNFYGNCSTQCAIPTVAPIQSCSAGLGIGCTAAGTCSYLHTSGTCAPGDGTCGDPNAGIFGGSVIYGCVNGTNGYTCQSIGNVVGAANDGCTTSANCINNNPCTGGVCIGNAVGASCVFGSCVYGAYCNVLAGMTGSCVANVALGGSCLNGAQCNPYNAVCGFGGICIAALSVPTGGNCAVAGECLAGLACNNGKCGAPVAITRCNQQADCINLKLGSCICDGDGTKMCSGSGILSTSIPTQCANYFIQLTSCAIQYQCAQLSLIAGSCVERNCPKAINCGEICVLQQAAAAEALPAACIQNPYVCKGAVSMTIGWVLLILLLALLL